MSLINIGDGVFADDETGEITGIADGTDKCLRVARQLDDAQQQVKLWEKVVAVTKAVLLKHQTAPTANYDGFIVRVQQNKHDVVDSIRLAARLREMEVSRDVLLAIISAAKVPSSEIPPDLADCVTRGMTEPFIVAARARKQAPAP